MTFASAFDPQTVWDAVRRSHAASPRDVRAGLASSAATLQRCAALVSPAAGELIEELAHRAHEVTIERFGRTMQLFAPLYVSNECVCTCSYCGFSLGLDIKRKTLRIDEVMREARALAGRGFRNILIVASEHPKALNAQYLAQCVAEAKREVPYVALEVAAAQTPDYAAWVEAGCDGVVLYQETYDPQMYPVYHLGGPKKHYAARLDAPQRAAAAGVRHLGLGALLGLSDWRFEALSLFLHARYLYRYCWQAQINLSFPRINPAAAGFRPPRPVSDAELVQLIAALRIMLPHAGIVLSTREPADLRDGLIPLGVTQMSAGSSTEPGGYSTPGDAGEQFHLEDLRSAGQVACRLMELGYDPVFIDWQGGLACGASRSKDRLLQMAAGTQRAGERVERA